MNQELAGLLPSFRDRVEKFLERLTRAKIRYQIDKGYRSPWEQAKRWRQGRSSGLIQSTIMRLIENGYHPVALLISEAGPQDETRILTNALPWKSAHQFRCAIDIFPFYEKGLLLSDDAVDQTALDVQKLWKTCGQLAKECSLDWGEDSSSFMGRAHYQHRSYEKYKKRLFEMALRNPDLSSDEIEVILGGQ